MQFIHQPLTWAFLLVLLPLLIHLINMMRHRRVDWAAMEFLLASHRKHRRWIWLKQLLLLLMRMAAVAAAVAMFAKLVTDDRWGQLFGRQTTHHYVLLDDSLSMNDQTGSGSAFDRARQSVSQLVSMARRGERGQLLTLIRFSRAARAASANRSTAADLNARLMNDELELMLEDQKATIQASQLAVGPAAAIELVAQLVGDSVNQRNIVHVVSDFRKTDWQQPEQVREQMTRLENAGVQLNLIRCVDAAASNLAVTDLVPEIGTQAAGVPLFMEAEITNYGNEAAERVKLHAQSVFYPRSVQGVESTPQTTDLPDIVIDKIAPGESVRRRFQVYFATAGEHVVRVELPSDPIREDNRRWCVVKLQAGESALIVDGQADERSAFYLQSVFRPSAKTKTGILPVTQPVNYLRDATPDQLASHHAIYLLDVPPLDQRTQDNLRQYVQQGGGLAWFLGPNYRESFYTTGHAAGLFPCPLRGIRNFSPPDRTASADVQMDDHPIFAAFSGERNPFASSIRIRRHAVPRTDWRPDPDSGVAVLASLRDGTPLVVERKLGAGSVIAFLTTLAPDWNNWALQPSFIVVALQLHGYLAQPQRPREDRLVGSSITVQLDAAEYQPEILFEVPELEPDATRQFATIASTSDTSNAVLSTTLGSQSVVRSPDENGQLESEIRSASDPPANLDSNGSMSSDADAESELNTLSTATDVAGIYTAQLSTIDAQQHVRRFALNIDPIESDTAMLTRTELQQTLSPLNVNIFEAEQPMSAAMDAPRNTWSEVLLWILLVGLLFEQWLAYRLSYHAPRTVPAGGTA